MLRVQLETLMSTANMSDSSCSHTCIRASSWPVNFTPSLRTHPGWRFNTHVCCFTWKLTNTLSSLQILLSWRWPAFVSCIEFCERWTNRSPGWNSSQGVNASSNGCIRCITNGEEQCLWECHTKITFNRLQNRLTKDCNSLETRQAEVVCGIDLPVGCQNSAWQDSCQPCAHSAVKYDILLPCCQICSSNTVVHWPFINRSACTANLIPPDTSDRQNSMESEISTNWMKKPSQFSNWPPPDSALQFGSLWEWCWPQKSQRYVFFGIQASNTCSLFALMHFGGERTDYSEPDWERDVWRIWCVTGASEDKPRRETVIAEVVESIEAE